MLQSHVDHFCLKVLQMDCHDLFHVFLHDIRCVYCQLSVFFFFLYSVYKYINILQYLYSTLDLFTGEVLEGGLGLGGWME